MQFNDSVSSFLYQHYHHRLATGLSDGSMAHWLPGNRQVPWSHKEGGATDSSTGLNTGTRLISADDNVGFWQGMLHDLTQFANR